MPYTPVGGGTSTSTGFAGTGVGNYSVLGVTYTQGSQRVVVDSGVGSTSTPSNATTADLPGATTSMRVVDLLAQFNALIASDPAQASQIAQQLYDNGLMSDSVYNSGGAISNSDIYNAYKKAVLGAASTGKLLGDYIIGVGQEFKAAGGPKVKLPNVRYTATLTSQADVMSAGDAVFEKILGRRMTPTELAAIHSTLNTAELTARNTEAQSAYSQLLGYRGLSATGTPAGVTPTGAPGDTSGGTVGGFSARTGGTAIGPAATTVGGTANLSQQVTNAQGQTSTVTSGPIVTPYQQPPSADASAYQYAMTNDQAEVQGRTVAAAMQAIASFLGKP